MVIIEALLLTIMLLTCGYVSYTDIQNGIIQNHILVLAGTVCCVLNILYYSLFAREYVFSFLINFVLLALLSVGMYALNLWAAGDSKLLFLVVFAIPGRLYNVSSGAAPAVYIIVFAFAISFIYVVAESLVLSIQKKKKLRLPAARTALSFMKNYLSTIAYIWGINYLAALLFPVFSAQNMSLISLVDLFLTIVIYKYSIFFKISSICIAAVLSIGIAVTYGLRYGFTVPDMRVYLYIAVIMALRSVSEEYNYQIIPTESVKPGMILALSTTLAMAPSKVSGLPRATTEDMRSRLSPEEAAAVVRWKTSKYGSDTITIVRKIPFAIFITLGVLTFIFSD